MVMLMMIDDDNFVLAFEQMKGKVSISVDFVESSCKQTRKPCGILNH